MIVALELRPDAASGWLLDEAATLVYSRTRALAPENTPAQIWLELISLARELCFEAVIEPARLRRLALVFPGALDANGVVKGGEFGGYDLRRGLREHLQTECETIVASASVAEAWAQSQAGILRGDGNWLYLSLEELECVARCRGVWLQPDVGALVLERGGALDERGKRGTFAALCAARAFRERARSYALDVSLPEVWALAPSNFAAQSLAQDYVSRLAQGLAGGIAITGAQRICLGGELGRALFATMEADLASQLRDYLPPALWSGDVVLAAPGESGAIAPGALALASLGAAPL